MSEDTGRAEQAVPAADADKLVELTQLVEQVLARVGTESAGAREEVRQGLMSLDQLLEDWLVAAEATDAKLQEQRAWQPPPGPPQPVDPRRIQELMATLVPQSLTAYQVSQRLPIHTEVNERWRQDPGASGDLGAARRLLETYAPDLVDAIANLATSRSEALSTLLADAANKQLPDDATIERLHKGYRDLVEARSHLMRYLRETFPLTDIRPPRPYNINVSGGTVGVIGDYGTTNFYPGPGAFPETAS